MSDIGKPEPVTQHRVIALFRDELLYRFIGDRSDRDNSNIEEDLLAACLSNCKYTPDQIGRAIIVHEMAHLLEPTHNEHLVALMDQFMPNWQSYRQTLNRLPVRHENWAS